MTTKIRLSNITQPLDQDLSVPNLTANGSITATGDLSVGGNADINGSLYVYSANNSYAYITDTSTKAQLDKVSASGDAIIKFSPIPSDETSSAAFQFFRNTNTTGSKNIYFNAGNGTGAVDSVIGLGVENTHFNSNGGNFGVGTDNPLYTLDVSGDLRVTGDIVTDGKIGAGITSPLGNIHSKSTINNLLILESEDFNSDIIGVDTGGSTRLRSASGQFQFFVGGNASSTGVANGAVALTVYANTDISATNNVTIGGNLTVSGDFLVSGNTTTINSNDLAIEDLNITLANGAANSAVADGAGITIDGANAQITYEGTNDEWQFNKNINVDVIKTATGIEHADDSDTYIKFLENRIYSDVGGNRVFDAQTGDVRLNGPDGSLGVVVDTGGYVGIGTSSPSTYGSSKFVSLGASSNTNSYAISIVNPSDNTDGLVTARIGAWIGDTSKAEVGSIGWTRTAGAYHESLFAVTTRERNTGALKTRLLIDADGKVGIGTSSPGQRLHIESTSGAAGSALLRLSSTGTASLEAGLEFFTTATDSTGANRSGRIYTKWDGASYINSRLSFQSMSTGNVLVDTMHLKNGNVGIGTSSPATKLQVVGNTLLSSASTYGASVAAISVYNGSSSANYYKADNHYWQLAAGGDILTINSAGNVGIGTALKAHYTGYTALDIGASGSIFSNRTTSNTNVTMLTNNAYLNSDASAWTYIHNDEATRYTQASGKHLFYNAVASTGNITWKEALVIDGSNMLGANVSNPSAAIHTYTSGASAYSSTADTTTNMTGIKVTASPNESIMTGIWFGLGNNETGSHWTGIAGSRTDYTTTWGTRLSFYTHDDSTTNVENAYERLTIDSSGNVGIGTSDPQYQLHVKGAGDIKIEDDAGGSAHLRIASSTSGTRDSEWKVKVSGPLDEFHIDHDYTAGGVSVGTNVFKISGTTHSLYNDNNQPTIRPTLNLDFANSKQLDPRITFYRDSIATYYDSKGVLRYVNENEPRFDHDPVTGESKGLLIEEARRNLLTNTQYVSSWTKTNITIYDNAAISPTGKFDAAAIYDTLDSTGSNHYYSRNSSETIPNTSVRVGSVYAKKGSQNGIQIRNVGAAGPFSYRIVNFDLNIGVVTTTSTYQTTNGGESIEDVGNGWYRCSVWCSFTDSGVTNSKIEIYPFNTSLGSHTYTGTGEVTHYSYGAQLEVGSFPTSYVPSDTRFTSRSSVATYYDENGILREAPANSPRYGYKYDGRKWVETRLILEQESTNSIQNFFSNAGALQWSTNQNSEPVATSSVTAPDGSTTAFKQEINSVANGIHSIYDYGAVPVGQQLCFSVYAKAAEYDRIYLYSDGIAPTIGGMWYDLSAGTVAGGPNNDVDCYGIENVGDGWYRCWFSGTSTSGATAYFHIDIAQSDNSRTFVGTVGEGVYLWGPQREYSASPSSYIYTDTVNVTRSADVASSTAYTRQADFAHIIRKDELDFYNEDAGTLYYEVSSNQPTNDTGGGRLGFSFDGSNDNRWMVNVNSASYDAFIRVNGQSSVSISGTAPGVGVLHKSAIAATSNDAVVYQNGVLEGSDSSAVMPKINQFRLYNPTSDNNFMCGHFKKVAYYPERLSNAELQALTENN